MGSEQRNESHPLKPRRELSGFAASAVTGLGMALSAIAMLGLTSLIVYFSSPSVVADIAVLNVVVLFLSVLLRFGADRLMVPEVRRASMQGEPVGREAGSGLLSASMLMALIGAAVAMGIPQVADGLSRALSEPLSNIERWVVAAWLFADAVRLVASEGHRSLGNYVLAAVSGFGLRAPLAVALVAFQGILHGELTRESVIFSCGLASMTVAILSVSTISGYFSWWRASPAKGLADLWRANLWMLLATLTGTIVGGAHVWIAGATLPSVDAGVYSVAVSIVAGLAIINTAINGGLSPRITSLLLAGRHDDVQNLTVKFVRMATILSAVGLGFLCLVGPKAVLLLGDDQYRRIGELIFILGLGQVISTVAGLSGWVLMAARQYRAVALSSAMVAVGAVVSCTAIGIASNSAALLAVAAATATAALPIANGVIAMSKIGIRTDAFVRMEA